MISWDNFCNYNTDKTGAFEDLSRLIFKKKYLNDVNYVLTGTRNNPGIESDPVMIDSGLTGYQAKFFEKGVNYKKIKESIEMAHKHYPKLNKIVLFCNLSIGMDSDAYKNNVGDVAGKYGIKIVPMCNEEILDYILNSYEKLINIFFDGKFINKENLNQFNDTKLKMVGEKYFKSNHIQMKIEDKLDAFILSEGILNKVKSDFNTFLNQLGDMLHPVDELSYDVALKSCYKDISNYITYFISTVKELKLKRKNDFVKLKREFKNLWTNCEKRHTSLISELKNNDESIGLPSSFDNEMDSIFDCFNYFEERVINWIDYIASNVMILEGDAGTGKTHLLSRIVDKHRDDGNFYFFVVGNLVINANNPSESLMNYFNMPNNNFFDFLDSYETYCTSKGLNAYVIFDAINEVKHYSEWNKYLSELLIRFEKYNSIKILVSIRTSFLNSIFDDFILKKLNDKTIIRLIHHGFDSPTQMMEFMSFYGLKYKQSDYKIWFKNPLYLKMYCEVNKKLPDYEIERNPLDVFMAFIKREEARIRKANDMNPNVSISLDIISKMAKCMFESNTSSILYSMLPDMFGQGTDELFIAKEFIRNEVLVSLMQGNQECVCFCYQRIYDTAIIKHIFDNYPNYDDMLEIIKAKLISGNLNEDFYGVLSQLFFNCRDRMNRELIADLYYECDEEVRKKLSDAYVESLTFLPRILSYDLYAEIMLGYGISSFENMFGMLINSFEYDNIQEFPLTRLLITKEMNEIDKIWTININGSFYNGTEVFKYFNKIKDEGITEKKFLHLSILTWFLSSTCRDLRDQTTKLIAKNLINDYSTIIKLIISFLDVKDMYIKERLFASIYGAIMNSEYSLSYRTDAKKVCDLIYNNIFKKIGENVNILLRDYCLNIIVELSRQYKFRYGRRSIYPRYKDVEKIVNVPIEDIKRMYELDSNRYASGFAYIYSSMHPNLAFDDGSREMYGDFGRYIFEIKLSNFYSKKGKKTILDQEKCKIFKYAYYLIVSKFKYDNEAFSKYDTGIKNEFYDRSTHSIERIGKKYEWIAMYHLLALVSSKYYYKESYTDFKIKKYYGPWRPHIRDIDPTFLIQKTERMFDVGFSLMEKEFAEWNLNDNDWYANNENSFYYVETACLRDSSNNEWICLFRNKEYKFSDESDAINQSIWSELSCCLLKKKNKSVFINEYKDISFFGRWANASQGDSSYSVFLREYHNSMAYKREFREKYRVLEKPTASGKNGKIKKNGRVIYRTKSGKIRPTYVNYFWEENEDFSVTDSPNVNMPIKEIVDYLDIKMKKPGLWYDENGVLVCADFRYVNTSNADGLYIRKDYFTKFLVKNNLDILWICLGEKIASKGFIPIGFNALSSLVYYDGNELKSINKSDLRE